MEQLQVYPISFIEEINQTQKDLDEEVFYVQQCQLL